MQALIVNHRFFGPPFVPIAFLAFCWGANVWEANGWGANVWEANDWEANGRGQTGGRILTYLGQKLGGKWLGGKRRGANDGGQTAGRILTVTGIKGYLNNDFVFLN